MKTLTYRCTPSAKEVLGAEVEISLTIPEGYIPPPSIDVHRPCIGTVTYYSTTMYCKSELATP